MCAEIWQHDQTKQKCFKHLKFLSFEHDISSHINKTKANKLQFQSENMQDP